MAGISVGIWLALALGGAALLAQALLLLHAYEAGRFARSRTRKAIEPSGELPHVTLIVPCKGRELELTENLAPLFAQEYPAYELRLVVESADDAALPVLEGLCREHPGCVARVIVAGRATEAGQKVHNLRAALRDLAPRTEVLAFADSDARPRTTWLLRMSDRLARAEGGAVTGYRWFVPVRADLGNLVLSAYNAAVAALFTTGARHLVWGGAWAIRRTTFEELQIDRQWRQALSDDLVVSRELRRAGRPILFEPAAMAASPWEGGWRAAWEFVRRQYLIGKCYTPRWWLGGLAWLSLAQAGLWCCTLAALWALPAGRPGGIAAAALAGALYAAWALRALARGALVQAYVPQPLRGTVRRAELLAICCGPLVALWGWLAYASTVFGRTIVWRGIEYRMGPLGRVESIVRSAADSSAAVPPPPDQTSPTRPHWTAERRVQPISQPSASGE